MKKYALKTKLGESIALTNAENLEEAQVKFSIIKALDVFQLLTIFIVEHVA